MPNPLLWSRVTQGSLLMAQEGHLYSWSPPDWPFSPSPHFLSWGLRCTPLSPQQLDHHSLPQCDRMRTFSLQLQGFSYFSLASIASWLSKRLWPGHIPFPQSLPSPESRVGIELRTSLECSLSWTHNTKREGGLFFSFVIRLERPNPFCYPCLVTAWDSRQMAGI